jgi:HD superfamily phosphohydrolase
MKRGTPDQEKALHLAISMLISRRARKAWYFFHRCRVQDIMLRRALLRKLRRI